MAQEGDRIELVSSSDPYTNLSSGDRGTVTGTQTIEAFNERQVHVEWDSGSNLSLIAGEDRFKIVNDDEDEE